MKRRRTEGNPVWKILGMPIVHGLALTGLIVIFSLLMMGEPVPHQLFKDIHPAQFTTGKDPFDLQSIRERLSADALERVKKFIDYYRDNRRRGFRDSLARSTRYLEPFKTIFREKGLPEELAYLPLIESGFVETAVSPAKAVGVWQFIEETGRRYNLRSSQWYDQKRDPIRSARAAAGYLGHLYDKFQNWELALAAYNCGAGTVSWALRKNRNRGLPENYWALDLPQETRAYVPAFLAALLIARNPAAFGFEKIDFQPQVVYEQVKVNSGIHLADLAPHLGTNVAQLRSLNPSLLTSVVPPGPQPYLLRIPDGMLDRIPERLVGQDVEHTDWLVHRVAFTDTVQALARQFRSNAKLIKETNRLRSNGDLRPGRFVIIPL